MVCDLTRRFTGEAFFNYGVIKMVSDQPVVLTGCLERCFICLLITITTVSNVSIMAAI